MRPERGEAEAAPPPYLNRYMVFVSRKPSGPDRYLPWKIAMLAVAAALFLSGVRFEQRWLVWGAIAALAVGFLLRFIPRHGEREEPGDEP